MFFRPQWSSVKFARLANQTASSSLVAMQGSVSLVQIQLLSPVQSSHSAGRLFHLFTESTCE